MKRLKWPIVYSSAALVLTLAEPTYGASSQGDALQGGARTSDYVVMHEGPHARVWGRVESVANEEGKLVTHTNTYVELQTGMMYQSGGQWLPSEEVIEGFPGGAVARRGTIQMAFANNLNMEGAIDAQTPAGRLRSHVLALAYFDSSLQKSALVANVQDCQGQLIAPNQVLYPKAFSDGVLASVRYTYRKAGYEQDVIIDDPGSLPAPEALGFNSSSATLSLQVITEFLNPPMPSQQEKHVVTAYGGTLVDNDIDWGALRLGEGQAFALGTSDAAQTVRTTKRWVVTRENRHLLVEEVPFHHFVRQYVRQSHGASMEVPPKTDKLLASLDKLPRLQKVAESSKTMELADAPALDHGILIDYATLLIGDTNHVFQNDVTTYISGTVNLYGTTVCEGGTVIKFTNNPSSKISMSGPLTIKADQFRPVILTSKDDNTVGEAINGSTGSPTNSMAASYLEDNNNQSNAYQNLRILYAGTGISADNFSNGVWHCQFVNCGTALKATGSNWVALHNVLLSRCTNAVVNSGRLSAEHLTVDQCTTLLSGFGSSGGLTNSILTGVTSNGNLLFYNCALYASGTGVYQSVGSGNYYLADSTTNRNVGTTNLSQAMLSALRTRTTYPPTVWTNAITAYTTFSPQASRDTDTPDRGYHYDPLDYAISGITLTNILVLTNGVCVSTYGDTGLKLGSKGKVSSVGTPLVFNHLVRYNSAQEQPALWGNTGTSLMSVSVNYATPSSVSLRFTDISVLANPYTKRYFINNVISYPLTNISLTDCTIWGGSMYASFGNGGPPTMNVGFTNNVFYRCYVDLSQDIGTTNSALTVQAWNNVFYGGTVSFNNNTGPDLWKAYDNLFDKATLSSSSIQNGYNGYVTNYTKLVSSQGHDVFLTNSPVYQTSYLGSFYYPTNDGMLSFLINAGSRSATNATLYHYTTTAIQAKEATTQVDIGYHYVAVNSGNPVDTDGDGLADYFEDANGNGIYDAGETDWLH